MKDDCYRARDHPAVADRPEPGAPRAKEWKMGEDSYDLEGGGDGEMAFSDKTVRRGFIKKVYAIISVQVSLIRKLCFSLKKTLFSFY